MDCSSFFFGIMKVNVKFLGILDEPQREMCPRISCTISLT